ncbi:hypothetical protein AUC70_03160 [Methyloceanibacter stevinii]|uniref:Glycosyltransferase 2-like domain-containing protein n=1 Tax=Methyloceanibacter stevinii TaxID=1774970 RepID=A0A1E3VQR5_9HYPH|nr:glycosyltransferase family 2 protein [Methyloceanibacter stevinii]ODR95870.1 hypothetical protein AUC70_03160 [Methyloceanibacter stevinii]
MPKVHVIIPTHNRKALAEMCLEHVFAQTAIDSMSITIVDDGSTDGTALILAEKFSAARVIEGDGNLWWTGAVAKALDTLWPEFAPGDFFLLVNDDTLLHPDTVEALVETSERCQRAGVAPIALDAASGQAISTGWAPGSGPILNDLDKLDAAMAEHDGLYQVQALFGRCSLFPVEILHSVRNYDAAAFPHYYGDVDFCLRAGKEGFRFFATNATSIEVVELQAATGVHFTFRQGPQDFPAVLENMTSIRSIENVPLTWHYMRRHFPGRAGPTPRPSPGAASASGVPSTRPRPQTPAATGHAGTDPERNRSSGAGRVAAETHSPARTETFGASVRSRVLPLLLHRPRRLPPRTVGAAAMTSFHHSRQVSIAA